MKILANPFTISDSSSSSVPVDPPLPPMKRRDFTLEELKQFDGTGPDGRVLIGVLGKVYDVTKGKRFYGPGNFDIKKGNCLWSNLVFLIFGGPGNPFVK